jgi:hypothetical protein
VYEELFPRLRSEPRLPLAVAEPGPLMTQAVGLAGPAGMTLRQLRELFDLLDARRFERGLVQLRADRAGDLELQVVLRCR